MGFLDHLPDSLALVMQWSSLAALAIGVAVGVLMGAVPGMSATMAVALALPFTFALPTVESILLLLGVYKGGIFGGSIPAILIRTPGTPASSATVLDGHPMAEQGRAGKALSMSLYASCTADFVSNLALILATGWLASFALSFGPPEFFALILFSLTIIAGVSGDDLLKGAIAALFGLLIATVGLDLVYGTSRFTFGDANLMGGLNFIAVLIGLFAIPEIIHAMRGGPPPARVVDGAGARWVSRAEYRRSLPTILRGSLIGVVLGAIPGIGGAPAAFLSYSEARRRSPNPEAFGRGEIDGVAAAESGNNGVAGATLIPLLALGVPGDVITAIIIGAFMIHGLQPGPVMFAQNGVIIHALFIGLVFSSVILLVVGALAIRGFRFIADVPPPLLHPAVLVMCVVGVYAVNNSLFDVGVMFAMGWVGYAMRGVGLPAAPFLIAFILGPLLEDNFRQSMLMSQGGLAILWRGPICWFFWSAAILTVIALSRSALARRLPAAA